MAHVMRHQPRIDYDKVVRDFYKEDDKAVILCKVNSMEDIISHYSVPGRENLNPEITAYFDDNIFYIPLSYPIAIRFCGYSFSEEEKEVIRRTMVSTYEFKLALAQAELSRNKKYSLATLALGALFFALYFLLDRSGVLGAVLTLFFWFFLWEFGMSGWTQYRALRSEIKYLERIGEGEIQFEDTV